LSARRGFTLIEIMIALALAGLVVGGALQLHASFNKHAERQSEVADMQQTLRVAMLMIEREIRDAGNGLPGGKIVEGGPGVTCAVVPPPTHYGFRWWDKNAGRDDSSDIQTSTNYVDPTPDSFATTKAGLAPPQPVFADSDTTGKALTLLTTAPMPMVSDPTYYYGTLPDGRPLPLFAIIFPPNAPCSSAPYCVDSTVFQKQVVPVNVPLPNGKTAEQYSFCVRELTAAVTGTGKVLQHDSTAATRCLDPPAASDLCIKALTEYRTKSGDYPSVRRILPQSTMFRVMTADDPLNTNTEANATPSPKLTMRTAYWGTADNDPGARWTIVAENIDDMQIALVMRDGTVQNRLDDPATQFDPTLAFAVRVTLRVRSSSPIAGLAVQPDVGAEDEPVGPPGDDVSHRYLRRSLTAEIELRNMHPANP
jgi:prepilin-type N-terminal cleavage/methylation domain-containing protein